MDSQQERRYRRLLRLLPAWYRRAWEEDMVSTFLASASERDTHRLSLSERLSVVALAARLWLGGDRTVTDARPWHRFNYCFSLMALLHLALQGTTEVVGSSYRLLGYASGDVVFRGSVSQFVLGQTLGALVGLLLVAAFWYFASGRFVVPRLIMLATLTLMATPVMVITIGSAASMITAGIDVSRVLAPIAAVPLIAATTLFTVAVWASSPAGPAPRRWLWLGGYAAGATVLAVTQVAQVIPLDLNLPPVTVDALARPALLAGMLLALSTAAGRRRFDWLFALALLAGVIVIARLLTGASGPIMLGSAFLSTSLDVALVALAVACAWSGWVIARATRIAER